MGSLHNIGTLAPPPPPPPLSPLPNFHSDVMFVVLCTVPVLDTTQDHV